MLKRTLLLSAAALSLAAGTAAANVTAKAVTDLNLRAGPGPQHEVVDVIRQQDDAKVEGCLETRDWCKVSYQGTSGWAYGKYLTASLDEEPKPIVASDAEIEVGTIVYENEEHDDASAAGGIMGAIMGAAIGGGPAGAIAGAIIGGTAGAAAEPETEAVTYVRTNQIDPVYLDGEVVTGARLPDVVTLAEIPDSDLRYAYVNGLPVIVEPKERVIVHVVR